MEERMETQAAGTLLREILAPEGWCGRLLTPIRKVEIVPESVAVVFKQFLKRIGVRGTFTLAELLMAGELLHGREVYGKPGDGIYLLKEPVKDPRLGGTLMSRSVPGLYGLLTAAGGAELHLPAGISEERIAYDRLLLLREKDGERLCSSGMVPLVRVGTVAPDRLLVSAEGTDGRADLTDLTGSAPKELTVENADAAVLRPAAHAVLGYGCCATFPGKYYVNLASDGTLVRMFVGALGLFDAMTTYRFPLPPMRFRANGSTGLVVPRPQLYAGDSVYVFQPKQADGYPLPAEYNKLRMFLLESCRTKKVRSVLPLKGNAPSMLRRMGGDKLTYAEEAPVSAERFAMLGVLPFGESAPGTRAGHYEPRETESEEVEQ